MNLEYEGGIFSLMSFSFVAKEQRRKSTNYIQKNKYRFDDIKSEVNTHQLLYFMHFKIVTQHQKNELNIDFRSNIMR
jgi:hypothetical protein